MGQAYKWYKYGVRARRIAELEARKQAVAERSKAGRDGQMSWCGCRAAARERKARPLLRCPARASRNAVRSPLPTAAPKNPPRIRRRRRSDFLPAPFGARVQTSCQ